MVIRVENKTSTATISQVKIEDSDIVLNGSEVCTFEDLSSAEHSTLSLVQNDILNALTAESWKELIDN